MSSFFTGGGGGVGWTPTFERYVDVSLAASATYTPAASGLYMANLYRSTAPYSPSELNSQDRWQTYSTAAGAWSNTWNYTDGTSMRPLLVIGDGTNLRFQMRATAGYLILFRMS
jgi:hypothetical protein